MSNVASKVDFMSYGYLYISGFSSTFLPTVIFLEGQQRQSLCPSQSEHLKQYLECNWLERQKLNYLPHCILYIGSLDGSIGKDGYECSRAGRACCTSCGHVTRSFDEENPLVTIFQLKTGEGKTYSYPEFYFPKLLDAPAQSFPYT